MKTWADLRLVKIYGYFFQRKGKLEIQIDFDSLREMPYGDTLPITESDLNMDVVLINHEANNKGMALLHARMFGIRQFILELDYLYSYEAIHRTYTSIDISI